LKFSQGVNRIGHIALRVDNLERAKSFYIKLGMNLVWDDKDWSYLEAGEGKDGLALLGPSYKAAGPHFAFHFENKKEVENICHQYINAIKIGEPKILSSSEMDVILEKVKNYKKGFYIHYKYLPNEDFYKLQNIYQKH